MGGTGHACRIPVPPRLTDNIGLVLGISPHVPLVLDVLLAVPPIGLLADLLPALLVDALHISDGGSARSEKQNFQFSCWQLSHNTLLSLFCTTDGQRITTHFFPHTSSSASPKPQFLLLGFAWWRPALESSHQ